MQIRLRSSYGRGKVLDVGLNSRSKLICTFVFVGVLLISVYILSIRNGINLAPLSPCCDVNDLSHLFPVIMDSGKGRILQLSKTTSRPNFLDFFDHNLNLGL